MSTPEQPSKPLGSRRHARQRLRGLSTPFGQVLDISDSGACVFRKGAVTVAEGDEVTLHIQHASIELALPARVVRTQSLGLRRAEVGLEFIGPTEDDLRLIRALIDSLGTHLSPSVWLAA